MYKLSQWLHRITPKREENPPIFFVLFLTKDKIWSAIIKKKWECQNHFPSNVKSKNFINNAYLNFSTNHSTKLLQLLRSNVNR